MRWIGLGMLWAALLAVDASAATGRCGGLKGLEISGGEIALATRGGTVRSAKPSSEGGGRFCKVRGEIRSVDSVAQPIRFEVNLPETWNHKAVQFGGGAFNGYLRQSDGLRATVLGEKDKPAPLARGYVTFGSDSGHHHHYLLLPDLFNALNSRFALDDEERKNFASEGLKKTHDVAMALMKAYYGAGAKRMYFIGGSTGGREAMMVVDRWPADYDGVIAAYAAWNQVESDLQFIRVSQAMYSKDGWLPAAKTKLLRDAVLRACDAQDGLKDGIVSDPEGCRFKAETLLCADGKSHRGCLSSGQERTVEAFATATVTDFAMQDGMTAEPGFNVLKGSDLVGVMGLSHHAFHPPILPLNSFYYVVGDGVLRFFLTKDEHFDALTFDWKTGGAWVAGIRQQSEEDDASLADLTPFEAHGGKLLLVHGVADATIPTDASVLLYRRIVSAMGRDRADGFLRLYLVPGFGHGHGVFNAGFDTVGVLDAWADQGTAPKDLVVIDQNSDHKKEAKRSRPMCAWPEWPKYSGGEISAAQSFVCVRD